MVSGNSQQYFGDTYEVDMQDFALNEHVKDDHVSSKQSGRLNIGQHETDALDDIALWELGGASHPRKDIPRNVESSRRDEDLSSYQKRQSQNDEAVAESKSGCRRRVSNSMLQKGELTSSSVLNRFESIEKAVLNMVDAQRAIEKKVNRLKHQFTDYEIKAGKHFDNTHSEMYVEDTNPYSHHHSHHSQYGLHQIQDQLGKIVSKTVIFHKQQVTIWGLIIVTICILTIIVCKILFMTQAKTYDDSTLRYPVYLKR